MSHEDAVISAPPASLPSPWAATTIGGLPCVPFGRYSHAWHLRPEQGKCRTLLLYVAVSCGWSDAVLVTLCSMGPGMRPMSLQKMAAVHDVIHQITSCCQVWRVRPTRLLASSLGLACWREAKQPTLAPIGHKVMLIRSNAALHCNETPLLGGSVGASFLSRSQLLLFQ
jgi:hypothetical protein